MSTANGPIDILRVDASGRFDGSITRTLSDDVVAALETRHDRVRVSRRDLARGVGFVDEQWIEANATPEEERGKKQRAALSESDELVAEIKRADTIVIGLPIYNFGIPATLKAWIDMICRRRLTFRYTDEGPVGLLAGKKVYVVVASGGVALGSDADFATSYLRHALGFIGLTDVEFIAADRGAQRGEDALDRARQQIADRILLAPAANADAA